MECTYVWAVWRAQITDQAVATAFCPIRPFQELAGRWKRPCRLEKRDQQQYSDQEDRDHCTLSYSSALQSHASPTSTVVLSHVHP